MGKAAGAIGGIAGGIGGALLGGPAGAATGFQLGSGVGGMLGGGGGGGGGGSNVSGAYNSAAAQQAAYAQQAAQMSQFRPVGITTGFGSSTFGYNPQGQLDSASYQLTPELQAIRNRALASAGAYNPEQLGQLAQPILGGAGRLFGLGDELLPTDTSRMSSQQAQDLANQYRFAQQGLMPTSFQTGATPEAMAYANQLNQLAGQVTPTSYDPTAAAQQYFQQQQELMQPGRAAEEARLATANYGRGTGGLGVQTGTGSAPSNPLAQALFNARAQQDRTLAAQSTDIARQRLADDIGLGTRLGAAGLTTQQQSEATQRANMLQNLGLSLDFGTEGLRSAEAGTQLARERFAEDLRLGSGLFGTGGDLLGQVPRLTTAGYSPLTTQLGLAQTVEGFGQQALDIGSALGARTSTAGANAGNMLLRGGLESAQTGLAGNIAQQGINAAGQTSLLNTLGGVFSNPSVGNWFGSLIGGGSSGGAYGSMGGIPGLGGSMGTGLSFGGSGIGFR
jgi:hypothetical protein